MFYVGNKQSFFYEYNYYLKQIKFKILTIFRASNPETVVITSQSFSKFSLIPLIVDIYRSGTISTGHLPSWRPATRRQGQGWGRFCFLVIEFHTPSVVPGPKEKKSEKKSSHVIMQIRQRCHRPVDHRQTAAGTRQDSGSIRLGCGIAVVWWVSLGREFGAEGSRCPAEVNRALKGVWSWWPNSWFIKFFGIE